MNAIRESEKLDDTLAFCHVLMSPKAYVGMGSGTGLIDVPFGCHEGVHQGAIESSFFSGIACNKGFQLVPGPQPVRVEEADARTEGRFPVLKSVYQF